jgi:5-formyltetrahydrofolate cyclo-ligase
VSAPDPKTELRRQMRVRRRAFGAEARQLAAELLTANVTALRLFLAAKRIAGYLPHDGEIDPQGVLERAAAMGKRCYLPVLSHLSWDRLWFAPLTRDTRFRANRFGIPEPQVKAAELVRAQELDLVMMPLVAFDARGNRLGMGGGYYDRSLAFLAHRRRWRRPHLLGLAYDFQRVDATLPTDAWDVPLTAVATERAVYQTENR